MLAFRKLAVMLMMAALIASSGGARAGEIGENAPTLRFGVALSLTGRLKSEGQLLKEGYELWREQINARGGIPIGNRHYRVQIFYRDDQSDAGNTAKLIEKLISENRVEFLLGPYGSAATFEAAAAAERYRIPLVQGGGAAEQIFASGFRYTFGLLGPASEYFKQLLEGAATLQPKPVRVAIVFADQSIHREIAAGASQQAKGLGFKLVGSHSLARGDDLAAVARVLKRQDPELILFSSYFERAVPFVEALKAIGLNPRMLAMSINPSQPGFVEQLGRDANYIYGTAQWLPSLPYYGPVFGAPGDYAALFRKRFGREPDYHAAAASAAGVAYQLALTRAGSLEREKVRDALATLDAMTFYGRLHFNAQGRDVFNPFTAFQIQKSQMVALWPKSLATGVAKYPAPSWQQREPELKVAVLHYGPVDDYGWTYAAYRGAEAMADTLPYVTLLQKERAYGADSVQTLRDLARSGYQVIFAHSYDFGKAIAKVAPDYPKVKFMWAGGFGRKSPNTGLYFGRAYQVNFLTGMVAGSMTRTNKIGYTAAMQVSEVIRGINAFARGVTAVNPDATVHVQWTGEWYNPPKEREVTLSLIDQGCDVITQHTDSYAPAVAADERGIYYISSGSDLRRFAPHTFLTGMAWNWCPIMADVVKATHENRWQRQSGQDWWYGLKQDGVTLIRYSDLVPDAVREKVKEKGRDMMHGKFRVFPGMSDEDLRSMATLDSNVVSGGS